MLPAAVREAVEQRLERFKTQKAQDTDLLAFYEQEMALSQEKVNQKLGELVELATATQTAEREVEMRRGRLEQAEKAIEELSETLHPGVRISVPMGATTKED